MSRQANFSTRDGVKFAPEKDSCNRFAPGACSLKLNQLDMRKQTLEQRFCCATYVFAKNHWCRRGSFAPGACCRSVLREQTPSCVPVFNRIDLFDVPKTEYFQ